MASRSERDELHKTIWAIANKLRGKVDGWDFKAYVLGTIFYRYISENLTAYINEMQKDAGIDDFDYAQFDDEGAMEAKEQMVSEKGFFILPSQLFCNVAANAANDETVGSDGAGCACPHFVHYGKRRCCFGVNLPRALQPVVG